MVKTYLKPNAILDGSISIEKLSDDAVCKLTKITYGELVELRNASKLIPGQQYRIIDYVTTTVQEDSTSAGHQFDIIVTADDESTLNEVARACLHEGDTYFTEAGANLAAWQIWYDLDNDKERFAWADNSVKSTIYIPVSESMRESMRGAFSESISIPDTLICTEIYASQWEMDFYKIDNLSWPVPDEVISITYPAGTTPQNGVALPETFTTSDGHIVPCNAIRLNFQPTEAVIDTVPTVIHSDNGKGVIYHMIDEWNNDCPYDFKNIQFTREVYNTGEIAPDGEGEMNLYLFTFSFRTENNEIIDASIFGNNGRLLNDEGQISGVYGNVIGQYMDYDYSIENPTKTTQRLNDIVFYSHYDFDEDGFYYGYKNNTFGNCCFTNSFGNDCSDNRFGNRCNRNSFGNRCNNNIFNDDCSNNTFGNYCDSNSFGNNCHENSFNDNCSVNSFMNNCSRNSFSNDCLYNSFMNNCSRNSFAHLCDSNSFGNDCRENTFGYRCSHNSFGNNCYSNSFRLSGDKTSSVRSWCQYNHFDDGCSYNVIWNSGSIFSNRLLKNINVNRGVSGTANSYNMINVDVLNSEQEIQIVKTSDGIYTYTVTEADDNEVDSVWNKIINE